MLIKLHRYMLQVVARLMMSINIFVCIDDRRSMLTSSDDVPEMNIIATLLPIVM